MSSTASRGAAVPQGRHAAHDRPAPRPRRRRRGAAAVGATDVVVCAAAGPGLESVRRAGAGSPRRGPRGAARRRGRAGLVAGQESAVVAHLDGYAARPRGTGVPLWRNGLAGRPTVVKNVETLARVGLLARDGELPTPSCSRSPPRPGPGSGRCRRAPDWDDLLDREGVDGSAGALLGGYHGRGAAPGEPVALTVGTVRAGVVRPLLRGSARWPSRRPSSGTSPRPPSGSAVVHVRAAAPAPAHDRPGRRPARHRRAARAAADGRPARRPRRVPPPGRSARTVASVLVAFPAEVEAHRRGTCLAARAVAV